MKRFLILIISILLANCSTKKESNYTFFGGKIINPKSEFVLLYKEHKVIDSIKLTSKNTFMSKLKDISPGLYFFKHGTEHQYVYLEPKDSLLIRLNTWGFDESLVFSGSNNAERNNVLIETFLQNEKDNKAFFNHYKLDSKIFETKIDSAKQAKNNFLETYKLNNPNDSQNFLDILEVALKYPLYTKLENFIRENSIKEIPENLNDSFLSHRETASVNKSDLMFYIPYRNYVYANLYSDIYQKKIDKENSLFTSALLKNIHCKITSEKQRNRLLRHITIRDFYNNSNGDFNKETFSLYFSLSSNQKDKQHLSKLLEDINKIKINQKLPKFTLLKANGELAEVNEIIKNKKTVIYFKGKRRSSDEWLASRVKYLMKKNKDTKFLVVNKETEMYTNQLDIQYQYTLNKESEAHQFLNCKYPRVVLVDEDGIIKNNFAALSSDKIEKQISDL